MQTKHLLLKQKASDNQQLIVVVVFVFLLLLYASTKNLRLCMRTTGKYSGTGNASAAMCSYFISLTFLFAQDVFRDIQRLKGLNKLIRICDT